MGCAIKKYKYLRGTYFILLLSIMLSACTVDDADSQSTDELQSIEVPSYFPPIPYPADNAYSVDKWVLGRKLFFDKRLSVDTTLSCASCHKQSYAFADATATTQGVKGRAGVRNVPSLANVAYHPYYTREGGLPTLEMQVLVPIQEHNEFDFNMVPIIERLSVDQSYQALSMSAYGRKLDAYVLVRALATFERSIISANSRYDFFTYLNRPDALTIQERMGMELFFSDKTNCSKCHTGFDLTTYQFANNGLYQEYKDNGRYRLTQLPSDLAMFKIPSLRNVALTAPYMHDGSLNTMQEVVNHYNSGGVDHVNKSSFIKPLGLTLDEKNQLIAFLHTLTDVDFIRNPYYSQH
jgi:cytochrome c peroxidase